MLKWREVRFQKGNAWDDPRCQVLDGFYHSVKRRRPPGIYQNDPLNLEGKGGARKGNGKNPRCVMMVQHSSMSWSEVVMLLHVARQSCKNRSHMPGNDPATYLMYIILEWCHGSHWHTLLRSAAAKSTPTSPCLRASNKWLQLYFAYHEICS